MNRKLLALYGLKFNPFAPELPTEALWIAPEVENFLWRIQFALVREGGFALITGESGSGKSVTLRLLSERLAAEPDLVVGAISRPQANVAEYVGRLFHADFHHASREVLTRQGQWVRPQLLAVLDDKSRLCCHAQWYLQEDAESFVHGLQQAFLKRGLPRALMTDNGVGRDGRRDRRGVG